jgi:hypothetical protein
LPGGFDEQPGELAGPLVVPHIASMDDSGGLLGGEARELVVGMAEGVDGDAGGEVEVLSVVDVMDPGALAVGENEGGAGVGVGEIVCM